MSCRKCSGESVFGTHYYNTHLHMAWYQNGDFANMDVSLPSGNFTLEVDTVPFDLGAPAPFRWEVWKDVHEETNAVGFAHTTTEARSALLDWLRSQ